MITRHRAEELCTRFGNLRIAVVGDLMLDRYVRGQAIRISPEAPVPVVRVKCRSAVLGGAANVLRNLAAFGATPLAFGVIGSDPHGDEFIKLCAESDIATDFIVRHPTRRTTVKTRVIANHQQVVRIDDEATEALDVEYRNKLRDSLCQAVAKGMIDAVIWEDYDKGVITQELVADVQKTLVKAGIPATLDPHPGNRFAVPGLTLMTPNRAESFAMAGEFLREAVHPVENDEALKTVAHGIRKKWSPKHLLITLGSGGMALFSEDGSLHHVPTVARDVFDVSGAGDTVIATWTAAYLAGATPEEACELANHAAGIVVGKVGTVCVDKDELLNSFND